MLRRWLPLSKAEKKLLDALSQGAQLKAHRYLDGHKLHKLYNVETAAEEIVEDQVVDRLLQRGLIYSNMKFPAATYVLTKAGRNQDTH